MSMARFGVAGDDPGMKLPTPVCTEQPHSNSGANKIILEAEVIRIIASFI